MIQREGFRHAEVSTAGSFCQSSGTVANLSHFSERHSTYKRTNAHSAIAGERVITAF
jgi:hypothetical protein